MPVPVVTDREIESLPTTGDPDVVRDAMADLCASPARVEFEIDYSALR